MQRDHAKQRRSRAGPSKKDAGKLWLTSDLGQKALAGILGAVELQQAA